jgi:hypothetical protein
MVTLSFSKAIMLGLEQERDSLQALYTQFATLGSVTYNKHPCWLEYSPKLSIGPVNRLFKLDPIKF